VRDFSSGGDIGPEFPWSPLWGSSHKGDLLGKTEAQLRSLHFKRDRGYLQS